MNYPRWIKVRQRLDTVRLEDPLNFVEDQLNHLKNEIILKNGQKIAVTAGSRSIANLVEITRGVVTFLKYFGAEPFLVPAMGSHGGATSNGQKQLLKDLGFTEGSMDIPIYSSMDVMHLGELDGIPMYFDKHAFESDGIVVINRVKAHQVFKGDIQSGLNKMMAIGLGKKKGADTLHGSGRIEILGDAGDFIRTRTPILFGVGILENSCDETRDIAVLKPDEFKDLDRKWAIASRDIIPKIPVRNIHMLLVEEMGKDISGSGMDTNVVGFTRHTDRSGKITVPLGVLDLTEKSDGNAIGIGLADFTTRNLVKKIDFDKTNTNVIATGIYSAGRVPISLDSEKQIMEVILSKLKDPYMARIIRIKNTLNIGEFYATEALMPDIGKNDKLLIMSDLIESKFNGSGKLIL